MLTGQAILFAFARYLEDRVSVSGHMHGRRKCVQVGGPRPEARVENHLPPFFSHRISITSFWKARKNQAKINNGKSFCIMFKLERQRPSSKKSWRVSWLSNAPGSCVLVTMVTSQTKQIKHFETLHRFIFQSFWLGFHGPYGRLYWTIPMYFLQNVDRFPFELHTNTTRRMPKQVGKEDRR